LLSEGLPHLLVYCRSADRAADLGDLLALRGFTAGRPGDDAEVWLGVDPLEVRRELEELKIDPESFVVLSADSPADADTLDRRHGGERKAGVVLVAPRGLPHLKRTALEAGYTLEPDTAPARDATERAEHFRDTVETALKDEDLVPYLLLLEPLIARYGAAEVAGALAALLRKKSPPPKESPEAPRSGPSTRAAAARRPPAWARLFLSVGQRDGIGTRDLLGAIVGESGITGDQVGRIEVKDHFSRVEVHDSVAERVIDSLNGTSIRGRSVRADFDRGEQRGHKRSESKKRAGSMHAKRGRTGSPKSRGPEAET
jgi:ATP-dependent RNA helicase DeaD